MNARRRLLSKAVKKKLGLAPFAPRCLPRRRKASRQTPQYDTVPSTNMQLIDNAHELPHRHRPMPGRGNAKEWVARARRRATASAESPDPETWIPWGPG